MKVKVKRKVRKTEYRKEKREIRTLWTKGREMKMWMEILLKGKGKMRENAN